LASLLHGIHFDAATSSTPDKRTALASHKESKAPKAAAAIHVQRHGLTYADNKSLRFASQAFVQ
jgi:hypothetical protein